MASLPQSTFRRFFLYALVIGIVTSAAALAVSLWVGRGMVNSIQEEAAYTTLRSTVELIGRHQIALGELRNMAMQDRKKALRGLNAFMSEFLDSYRNDCAKKDDDAARAQALGRLNAMSSPTNPIHIIDSRGYFLVHPRTDLVSAKATDFTDAENAFFLNGLIEAAHGTKDDVYALIRWHYPDNGEGPVRLAVARHYVPWNLVLYADVNLEDIDRDLNETRVGFLSELRARIREIQVGELGYVFTFDEDCYMIAHPTLGSVEFSSLLLPGGDTLLCQTLKDAAERPWGQNKLVYNWSLPQADSDYNHEKIAWMVREPTTGWYVGVSAYVQDLQAVLPRFFAGIFLPAFVSILILGGALAMLLRNLLRPVQTLTAVCQEVRRGDLSQEAPEDVPGEIGFLCRHFNAMVRALRELYRKEELRRNELQDLNRNLERKVAIRTKALERKARLLEESNTRLKELDSMKSAFLSSVSHELRTPLTSILGFAKLIAKDFSRNFARPAAADSVLAAKATRVQENLDVICQEGDRLTRLINDVLDLAKIESGRFEWRDTVFPVGDVVRQVVATIRGQIKNTPLSLEVEVGKEAPYILADRDRIMQVCLNLLNNAIKFTSKGRVVISVCARDEWLQVRVKDTGAGIPQRDLLKVFDKFHQAVAGDTLKQKPQGTGLGLAICRNIVRHYGGLIWAESDYGKGSDVVFELPVFKPQPGEELPSGDVAALYASRDRSVAAGDAPLVLIVDDEEHVRSYLTQLFESEGYRTASAVDGAEAVVMARELHPDCITMDILMPNMDGQQAMAALRNDPENPWLRDIPILVISALPDAEFDGGSATLHKPIDENQLMDTLDSLLLRESPNTRPCLVLLPDQMGDAPAVVVINTAAVNYCTPETLATHINEGFSGTVLVPANLTKVLDLGALVGNKAIQVVVVPELETPDAD